MEICYAMLKAAVLNTASFPVPQDTLLRGIKNRDPLCHVESCRSRSLLKGRQRATLFL